MTNSLTLNTPVTVGGKKVAEIEIPRPMKVREVADLQDAGENLRAQVRVLSGFLEIEQDVLFELEQDDFMALFERLAGEEKKPAP